jgi:hypothetical protein
MRSEPTWRSVSFVLVVSACAALAGCGSSDSGKKTAGEQRASATVTGLKETRAEIVAGRAQIDKTISSLTALRDGQGALQTEFAAFNDNIKRTEEHRQKIRTRADHMRARAGDYQAKWRAEMAKVDDPALRAAANERADKVRQRFDVITDKATEARNAYEPFMKQLKSVQTYLSNDLTPEGIQSASAVFDKAAADGKVVLEKIDAVVAELDSVASSMGPAAGAAPAKK